jgi:transcriptional regulator with XRE-family HTH domain
MRVDKMSIGNRIKELRKKSGLNQTELGEKLGLKTSTVSAMEVDRSSLTDETIIKLSEIFGVSTDYLLKGIETERTISENEQEILETLRGDKDMTNVVMEIAKLKKKAISYARGYNPQQEQRAVMG